MKLALVAAVALLSLPTLAKPARPAGGSSANNGKHRYTVQKGDTLECLDSKYGVQPGELAMLNGKPGSMTFKLVAGKTINTPVQLPKNACSGFAGTSGEKGAKHSLGDRACQVIDKTRTYTRQQAMSMLQKMNSSPTCLKAIEIASQPTVDALCEAVGNLLHSHHSTHSIATGIEFLCKSAHIAAHQLHEQHGGHGAEHGGGHGAQPASHGEH